MWGRASGNDHESPAQPQSIRLEANQIETRGHAASAIGSQIPRHGVPTRGCVLVHEAPHETQGRIILPAHGTVNGQTPEECNGLGVQRFVVTMPV